MSVILRDNIGIEPNSIPKDPTKQNKLIVENGKTLSDYTNSKDVFESIQEQIENLNQKFSSPEQSSYGIQGLMASLNSAPLATQCARR